MIARMKRAFAIAAGFLACVLPAAAEEEKKPNVVLFYTDDQGTLDANCYGSTDLDTPAIDRLAESGVRFTRAYAHTVCCPSRALLLTGRHPQRSGIVNWTQGSRKVAGGTNLPLEEITLAEALKTAGYKTAIFGKWHLGARAGQGPLEQGFDRFYGHLGGFIDNYNHCFLHDHGFHDLYDGNEEIERRDEYFPDLMTKAAVEYLDQTGGDPFFMYVAFNLPHYPEQPDEKFVSRYTKLEMPRRSYAAVVSTVDDRMGRILTKLESLGLRENTIVIFMSDNGHSAEDKAGIEVDGHVSGLPKGHYYSAHGGGGNTGKWIGRKGDYFEGGIRVPAIISYPAKLPKGEVREQAIIAADWFPTVLALCGVEPPDVTLDGKSLIPLIEDGEAPSPHKTLHWAWARGWAVREGPWKLIGNSAKPTNLVNLDDAEPERKNYLAEEPELARRLHQLHLDWIRETTTP